MDEYEKTLALIEEMRSRFESGFSSSDKNTIIRLYHQVCGKNVRNTGCNDCYRDAYIETRVALKRLGHMPKASNYVLKNGVLFHPQGTTSFYVLDTITDEAAEKELAKNPDFINKFSKFPTDYLERVKARAAGNAYEDTDSVSALKKQIALLKGQLADKDATIVAKDATIATRDAEIAVLKAAASTAEKTTATEEVYTSTAEAATPKARKTASKK